MLKITYTLTSKTALHTVDPVEEAGYGRTGNNTLYYTTHFLFFYLDRSCTTERGRHFLLENGQIEMDFVKWVEKSNLLIRLICIVLLTITSHVGDMWCVFILRVAGSFKTKQMCIY